MDILLIRNIEIPASVIEAMKSEKYNIIHFYDGGECELKIIKPEKFTLNKLKDYLCKHHSKRLVMENITLTQIKEIIDASKKKKSILIKTQPHGAYKNKDLSKEQLIFQHVFLADPPIK